ncbi:hypothetical protein DNHGIG_11590 [Collibacillus ludicampi]|uniref:M20/M25/M40 family metallo-hydrolase n=1 Tax=Collibacillus ludicampi TaxID=2771369 RepID=A0AAV4LCR2_9BACL|nr:M20/M25/M40 family metallo-hydrolase [Collibacillus ludicampi]GIM45610.1 hypothetical protein DNHGIG_11590 [Collibacillus ludicampi]
MKTRAVRWQTKAGLVNLLSKLVKIPSVTGSKAEIAIAETVEQELRTLPYFQENPGHVQVHPLHDGRKLVTALVKKDEDTRNTIILLSHFDVVDVQDYGKWQSLAFQPQELTETYSRHKDEMPIDVQRDMERGNWLFGRGIMDMKCGLALHMSMIEQACAGSFAGNLLLLTVPDEEVNSEGMRAAVPILLQLAESYDLEYKACLNSEPMFSRYPGDENQYIYTGSNGKLLPGFFCCGKETHVGEPFSGLNANYMASLMTNELELNTEFCEVVEGEVTPPPTNLIFKDLKEAYSTQVTHRAVTLFNLFLMEKPLEAIVDHLRRSAEKVAREIERTYTNKAQRFAQLEGYTPKSLRVNVLTFEELVAHVLQTYGEEKIKELFDHVLVNQRGQDEREVSIHMVDTLSQLAKEKWPMIVLFFAPPFYPPVSSRNHPLIRQVVQEMITYAKEKHGVTLKKQNYFSGISDSSYTGFGFSSASLHSLSANMPLWEKGYSLPVAELEALNVPVVHLGPVGRDAHKWTERLDIDFAFETLLDMMPVAIRLLLR